jgi:3-phenylpropionate/trans-cinnamate dioxygenase ferredoxin reductase component
MPHRADTWFATAGITVHRGDKAVAVDRAQRTVRLASGTVLPYRWLVLATGARARAMPGLAPGLANVAVLRTADDARRLRTLFDVAQQVTLVGGGFIGLEIAATARALGKAVTVLESAPRLLARSVSPEISAHVLQTHRDAGIDVRLGVAVGGFEVEGDRVAAVHVDGRREPLDLLVLGIGSVTEHHLAHDAGIECDNGIVVDACMRTSDPAVLAIGDCSHFPDSRSGRRVRLESVQNANDQARTAVATMLGTPMPYTALPWFWSEQGSMRLQMVGLMPPDGQRHRRPGATPASFSMLHYVDGRLVCVESVNAAPDHMAGRKLIEAGKSPAPAEVCDPAQPMKSFV